MHHLFPYLLLLTLAFCYTNCESPKQKGGLHPMVDGQKEEYALLDIKPIQIADGVNLYLFQNDAYVWISYDYPEGSFGGADVIIETETIQEPLNLHISAQLGEWPVGDESKRPQHPESDLWWELDGWTANHLWANGIDTASYDEPVFNIKNGEIREIQLAKSRFGTGEWKFQLNIYAILGPDGKSKNLVFPEGEEYYSLRVY